MLGLSYWTHRRAATRSSAARARGARGQSIVEFAILLPLLLAFVGLSIDFARVFQAWITIESATRDAAEAAATTATDGGTALDLARRTVCLQSQTVPGFQRSTNPSPGDVEACEWPNVTATFDLSTTAIGASTRYPVGTASINATLEFRPLFNYPFITQDGTWTISTESTFSIAQGRK
jgi:Flp pilus assembly protein TadG